MKSTVHCVVLTLTLTLIVKTTEKSVLIRKKEWQRTFMKVLVSLSVVTIFSWNEAVKGLEKSFSRSVSLCSRAISGQSRRCDSSRIWERRNYEPAWKSIRKSFCPAAQIYDIASRNLSRRKIEMERSGQGGLFCWNKLNQCTP